MTTADEFVGWPVTESDTFSEGGARQAADASLPGTLAVVEHVDGTWARMMKQPDGSWACALDVDGLAHSHRLDGDRIRILLPAAPMNGHL